MAFVPLVSTLLDRAGCRYCFDYDALVFDRRGRRASAHNDDCRKADLVLCTEAFDSLELDQIEACLDEMAGIAERLIVIAFAPTRVSSVGDAPYRTFLGLLQRQFEVVDARASGPGMIVVACPARNLRALQNELDFDELASLVADLAPPPAAAKASAVGPLSTVQQYVGGFWLALRDRRTPLTAKLIAALACILAVSPIDLTPDVIPHVRYLDDALILAFGTALAALIAAPAWAEFRTKAIAADRLRAVHGSLAIGAILVATLANMILHAWRPTV